MRVMSSGCAGGWKEGSEVLWPGGSDGASTNLLCFLARSVYGSLPGEVLAGDGLSPEERPSAAPTSPYRASVTTLVTFEDLRAVFPGAATYRAIMTPCSVPRPVRRSPQ